MRLFFNKTEAVQTLFYYLFICYVCLSQGNGCNDLDEILLFVHNEAKAGILWWAATQGLLVVWPLVISHTKLRSFVVEISWRRATKLEKRSFDVDWRRQVGGGGGLGEDLCDKQSLSNKYMWTSLAHATLGASRARPFRPVTTLPATQYSTLLAVPVGGLYNTVYSCITYVF